ncbi:c-type cytochrome [Thalassorhabdus alkalitolerans]|uniref:C-type cytochrome n=1 Tax=Thalassorhabdus alkalitolerans TaxID=2282697 RepID=A0ABW0YFW7_9BACI
MKKYLMAIGGSLVLILGACGAEEEEPVDEEAPQEAPEEEEQAGETHEGAGEDIYQGNCASCHGGDLEGGSGPALAGEGFSEDEVLDAIENGRPGMPADIVEGEEAEQVSAWVAQQ